MSFTRTIAFFATTVPVLFVGSDAAAAAPCAACATAYLAAVDYLRGEGAEAWRSHAAQGVLLGAAVGADPLVAGPRSTTELASLELASVDAIGRRARALAALGLDVGDDAEALFAVLDLLRPGPLDLASAAVRTDPDARKFGQDGTRVPYALDDALALQAVDAAGIAVDASVERALVALLERQIPAGEVDAGAWSLVEYAAADGGDLVGSIGATAQAVLALAPHVGHAFGIAVDPALGIDTDVAAAVTAAVAYLKAQAATADDPADLALLILALVDRDPTAVETASAVGALLALQDPVDGDALDGSFGASDYATALAARALLTASESGEFAFDSDGDGTADASDPDDDGDGICDPGIIDPSCQGSDAFPLDPNEQADLDNDGIGDNADLDDDGDGVPDASEPGRAADAQESADFDGDGIGDTADPDDDGDGLADVDELLEGLDPRSGDTDGDGYGDLVEWVLGTDGLDPGAYPPPPDGDIAPLGAPDGLVDVRDALLALRILEGSVVAPTGDDWIRFIWHADVAPLVGGAPVQDGAFGAGDALVILRLVSGAQAPW